MAGHTVTRAQLTEAVYQEVGLSRNESAELVESVIAEISDALERGEMVKISSFGSFAVRQKGQRVGRNPKTGAGGADQPAPRAGVPRLPRAEASDQHGLTQPLDVERHEPRCGQVGRGQVGAR